MAPTKSTPRILIVGAGPSGLALALALLQNGIEVRIIDKLQSPQLGQRGAAIQPRALELYGLLGILPDMLSWAGPFQKIVFHNGEKPDKVWDHVSYGKASPDIPYPDLVMIGQDKAESVLRLHLQDRFGLKVESGLILTGFEQTDKGVTVRIRRDENERQTEELCEYGWVIGADGAKGVVRKLAGFSYDGETRDKQRFINGDIHIIEGLDREYSHRWGDIGRDGVGLRPVEHSKSLFQYVVGGTDVDVDQLLSDRGALLNHIIKATRREDIKFGELVTIEEWRPNIRMANKFSDRRVFIIGDAAHIHSSSGGQGITSCIQDAMNLSWKLGLVERGLAPPSLLETYNEERRPVIEEMLNISTGILDRILGNSITSAPATRTPDIRQFGVNYRWSSIVVNEDVLSVEPRKNLVTSAGAYGAEKGDIHAGDRVPEAPGLVNIKNGLITSVFEILTCSKHTALIFTQDAQADALLLEAVRSFPVGTCNFVVVFPRISKPDSDGLAGRDELLFLQDSAGYAYRHYLAYQGPKVVLIRPDGVIGAICTSTEGLSMYRQKVFWS
ncbi:FAD binding domain-containing protein [Gymnopilus junonius]|uniref:FAD binding domain-containing protein n=1 Tax=Gymnopilus junonius TaxID=109634 RepID=A0A9P5TM95_GYMJU|nr:FAD binding domain-containing protein [Gymnopilus junonius]